MVFSASARSISHSSRIKRQRAKVDCLSLYLCTSGHENTRSRSNLILLFKKYIKFPFHRQISRRNDLAVNCLVLFSAFFSIVSEIIWWKIIELKIDERSSCPFKKREGAYQHRFFFNARSWPLRLSLDAWEERGIWSRQWAFQLDDAFVVFSFCGKIEREWWRKAVMMMSALFHY